MINLTAILDYAALHPRIVVDIDIAAARQYWGFVPGIPATHGRAGSGVVAWLLEVEQMRQSGMLDRLPDEVAAEALSRTGWSPDDREHLAVALYELGGGRRKRKPCPDLRKRDRAAKAAAKAASEAAIFERQWELSKRLEALPRGGLARAARRIGVPASNLSRWVSRGFVAKKRVADVERVLDEFDAARASLEAAARASITTS